jgi:RNA polymerase sigma-70 factor (sigma-E family)
MMTGREDGRMETDREGGAGPREPGDEHAVSSPLAGRQPLTVLEELLAARGERLLHAAVLLAGSHADGEDLLQAALERVFRHWRRIDGDPEGYLRTTLYHLAADGWRRKGMLRSRLGLLRQPEELPDETAAVDRRDELVRLLRELPPRQRTAIVLRYWEELSEAECARLMGCSTGTVKSAASRGLRRLRGLSGEAGGSDETSNGAPQATGRAS